MRLQSGIPEVSIAVLVVIIAAVSIAEPHHVMQLQCWVGLKQKFSFSYLRENVHPDPKTEQHKNPAALQHCFTKNFNLGVPFLRFWCVLSALNGSKLRLNKPLKVKMLT
jgi:hypothetical protein